MPVSTRRRLIVGVSETTTVSSVVRPRDDETPTVRRTRRRLLTTLEASSSESDKVKIEVASITQESKTVSTPPVEKSAKKTPSKPKGKARKKSPSSPASSQTKTAPPKDWESTYALVEELRQDRTAPVDGNGSEALPERHRGDKVFRFQVLIALMLSSQTKDAIVGEAMRNLQEHGLDVESVSAMSHESLDDLIYRVGFHNRKTQYIKDTVEILKEKYDGDIPPTAIEMMELPGVGPKMAFIVENVAWNSCTGIGIDTHMHRIYNELKWVKSKNPEQTRIQLESWLPEEYWPSVNVLWVGFGQEVQQFKPKIIRKALDCSRPADALRLIRRLGVDLKKEGAKMGVEEEIKVAIKL